jgi:predicted glutamine amidotransferase
MCPGIRNKINFLLIIIFFIFLINCSSPSGKNHECRFWGIIFSTDSLIVNPLIRTHLESLRALGVNNPDGWGFGYYLESKSDTLLPVLRRGEPSAPLDPRYPETVEELTRNIKKSAVAHVRRGSSGPTSGIPDPHPFRRKCINRRFDMLFAHNGTINTDILLKLIELINPFYLEQNPPDYAPNYLDSDLYSILLVEVMDEYPDLTIEECIKMAIIKLDSALGTNKAQLNFVMSSGNTLWALNFTRAEPKAITVYYYPDSIVSKYWVIASQPLDSFSQRWVEIPNRTLVCLRPNEPVRLIPIYQKFDLSGRDISKNFLIQPNPFNKLVKIDYSVDLPGIVTIDVYDGSGRFVRKLLNEFKISGKYTLIWDGCDDNNNPLPDGVYFIHLKTYNQERVLKTIFIQR